MADFSEAEWAGFELAFVEFWFAHPDNTRTLQELQGDAEKCLKGCQEHYHRGVTKLSRSPALIPPEMADAFKDRAIALISATDTDDFMSRVSHLIRDFPSIGPWISWWLRESHARMLFSSQRRMDTDTWDSIPSTTNAQESQHFKMYSARGKHHSLLEGLKNLYDIAFMLKRQFRGALGEFIHVPLVT